MAGRSWTPAVRLAEAVKQGGYVAMEIREARERDDAA